MRVIWANTALLDLDAIEGYYRDEVGNPHAAARVIGAIVTAGDALDDLPYRGRHLADGTFALSVVAYPQYRLGYDVNAAAGVVEIVHVETTRTATARPAARK